MRQQESATRRLAIEGLLVADKVALIDRIKQEAVDQLEALRVRMEAEKKPEIEAILRRFYGPRSERFDARQLLLFGIHVDTTPLDEPGIEEEASEALKTRRLQKRHPHGRGPLPDHLPRIEIEHDLPDTEKACPCCGEMRQRLGSDVTEQLEYLPASFKVLRHIRH